MEIAHFRIGYSVSGFLIGLLVGLTGVGGGSLMTPILVLVFGMQTPSAIGIDLLFAAITKSFGTAVHGSVKTVEWRVVWRMLAGSIPTTLITLGCLHFFGPPNAEMNRITSTALGMALIVTAVSVAFRPLITKCTRRRFGNWASRHPFAMTGLLGAFLGFLVPITSVGAAALGMPILLLLYPEIAPARLVGADIAHAVPLTLVAGLGHLVVDSFDPLLLATLVSGSIPGVVLGSVLSGRISSDPLRYIMTVALTVAGWKLLV